MFTLKNSPRVFYRLYTVEQTFRLFVPDTDWKVCATTSLFLLIPKNLKMSACLIFVPNTYFSPSSATF